MEGFHNNPFWMSTSRMLSRVLSWYYTILSEMNELESIWEVLDLKPIFSLSLALLPTTGATLPPKLKPKLQISVRFEPPTSWAQQSKSNGFDHLRYHLRLGSLKRLRLRYPEFHCRRIPYQSYITWPFWRNMAIFSPSRLLADFPSSVHWLLSALNISADEHYVDSIANVKEV
jgi:hypothetical protein